MTEPTALAKMPNLAAALAKVQAQLPKLERDRTVEVTQKSGGTYSYSYTTLANLSDAVLPLLAQHGLAFVAMPGTGSDGKMCLRYHLMHESGETLTGEFPISGEGGIQMIGGRITYARRYCLQAVTGVAADEDDESHLTDDTGRGTAQRAQRPRPARPTPEPAPESANTAQRARQPRPPLPGEDSEPRPITPGQQKMMHALLNKTGRSERDVALVYIAAVIDRPIESTKELSMREAGQVIDALSGEGQPQLDEVQP